MRKETAMIAMSGGVDSSVAAWLTIQEGFSCMGATMRLGAYPAHIKPGTLCSKLYDGKEVISERHRHRYEFNNEYFDEFAAAGLRPVGVNPESGLVEAVELDGHPWFIAVQYHPEYKSNVEHPHPLFVNFVKAAIEFEGK